ncbi:DUF998 domain-containing protein [Ornithinimicrobium sp. Y1847]|uniref:DUF998 domain-containing protein n=1 Tax=Ornithinimicrobium sp. Y1847 TaxID=3405419 RepID=UPI003B677B71
MPDTPTSPPPSARPSADRAVDIARWLGLLAAVLQLSWLLESVVGSPLPSRTAYVSELMASDQPTAWLFRGADTVAGMALLTAVLLSWGVVRRWRRSTQRGERPSRLLGLAHLGLGVFGVAMVVDAVLTPMSCAPSIEVACAQAELTGQVPLTHQLHSLVSSLSAMGALVGLVSAAVWAWSRRRRATVHVGALVAVALGYVIVTVWVLLEMASATPGHELSGRIGLDVLGWSQRAGITLSALGLALVATLPTLRSDAGRTA